MSCCWTVKYYTRLFVGCEDLIEQLPMVGVVHACIQMVFVQPALYYLVPIVRPPLYNCSG
jgi:hypothetical protein